MATSPDPEVILQLAQEIKEAKSHLAALQSRWDGYFIPLVSIADSASPPAPKKRGKRPFANSDTQRVLAKLAENPTRSYDKVEMGHALGIGPKQAERIMLKQIATRKIERRGRGRYGALVLEVAA